MGWQQSVDAQVPKNLAELPLPLPLSLADVAVDRFPQQVGVAAAAGVLLDHVGQHRAQRDAGAVLADALSGGGGGTVLGDHRASSGLWPGSSRFRPASCCTTA